MSIAFRLTVRCDNPGCHESLSTDARTARIARQKVGQHGWDWNPATSKDYCPAHTASLESEPDEFVPHDTMLNRLRERPEMP